MKKQVGSKRAATFPFHLQAILTVCLLFVCFYTVFIGIRSKAASVTVCNSGCDYTTITDAIAAGGFNPGDSIFVGADYASSTEIFPFNIPSGVILDCQNSGAIIGVDPSLPYVTFNAHDDVTVQNCRISNVQLQSTNVNNASILNNDFMGTASVTADLSTNITVSGNTGLLGASFSSVDVATFSSNRVLSAVGSNGIIALNINHSTSIVAMDNFISDQTTSTNDNYRIVNINNGSSDIQFLRNTVISPFLTASNSGMSALELIDTRNFTAQDNKISIRGIGGSNGINLNGSAGDLSAMVDHNTVRMEPSCINCTGILMTNWDISHVSVTSTYNLLSGTPSKNAQLVGHQAFAAGSSADLNLFIDHDGFAGLNVNAFPDFPIGPNAVLSSYSAGFKTDDADPDNDFELAPFSRFLDVSGTTDVGAVPVVRGNSFHVNGASAIDYSSVDATNTVLITASLRNGDAVHIANGDYEPVTIRANPTGAPLTGDISIFGSGAGTVIHATSTGNAFFMGDLMNSNVQDLVLTGAQAMGVTPIYKMTVALYDFNGNTYDQTGPVVGTSNVALVVENTSCQVVLVHDDGDEITDAVGSAMSSFNVGLMDLFGNKITLYIPNDIVSNGTDLGTFVNTVCGAPAVVDAFIPGVFTVSGGIYTYNAAAVALAGASVKPGEVLPPKITKSFGQSGSSGIELDDSNGITFTHVTSTGNSIGVSFEGSTQDAVFRDSDLLDSFDLDVLSGSENDNYLVNTGFIHASSVIQFEGSVHVSFNARALVQNGSAQPISGAVVSMVSADLSTSTVLMTGADGYTLFSATALPAFVMTSTSIAETSGGFNPYTIAASFTGYTPTVVHQNLRSTNQLFTLILPVPTPVSSGSGDTGKGGLGSEIPIQIPDLAIPANAFDQFNKLGIAVHDLVKIASDNNVATQRDSTIYYAGADGKLHPFPNPATYFSWYCDFKNIRIISAEVLNQLVIGNRVVYRPGLRFVKFSDSPNVYVVQTRAVLRHVANEAVAAALVGPNWNKQIDDIPLEYINDYVIGLPILMSEASQPNSFKTRAVYPSAQLRILGYVDPTAGPDTLSCKNALATAPHSTGFVSTIKKFLFP